VRRDRLEALGLFLLLFTAVSPLHGAAELRISNVKAQAGTKFLVPVTLSGGEDIVGLQFRVRFEAGSVSAPPSVMPVSGDLLAGHTVGANPDGNELHVVIFSSSLAPFRAGQGIVAYLILQLSAGMAAGSATPLQLTEVQATNANGANVALTTHDGSVTSSTALDPPAAGENELVFPQVANGSFPGGRFLSTLLVVNRTAATVTGTVRFYKSSGSVFSLRLSDGRTGSEFPLTVAEGGSALLQTDGSGPLAVGYARLSASGPVGGTILFSQLDAGGSPLVQAGVGASPAGTRFVIPVLYRKGTSNTGVAFANVSSQSADLTLTLRDKTGSSTDTASVQLAPGQHLPKFATELFGSLAAVNDFAGVLEAESSQPVSAVALKMQGPILTTFPVISSLHAPPSVNPVPVISGISPSSTTAGGSAFTLTVDGTDFVSGAKVRWNGTERTTAFVSSSQLTASIPASDVAAAGTAAVTVLNPEPGGGVSNSLSFVIGAPPKPQIQVSPASLDFGKVSTGATKQLTFSIQNAGTAALSVQSITKTSAVFSISSPGLPFSVAPGVEQAVTVTFAPTAGGGVSDTVTITSNDAAHPTVTIPLNGVGDAGTAPTIQQVTLTKLDNFAVKADVQFADPDGDIVKIEFLWYLGSTLHKTMTLTSPTDVNLAGLTSATISRVFPDLGITTPFGKVHPNKVEIQATDARNLVSNKVSKDF